MKKSICMFLALCLMTAAPVVLQDKLPAFKPEKAFAATAVPSQVTGLHETLSTTSSSITIKWNKTYNTSGYEIERYIYSTYKRIRTLSGATKISTKFTGLKSSTVYKYRVRAFRISNGNKIFGKYSYLLTTRTLNSSYSISAASKKLAAGYKANISRSVFSLSENSLPIRETSHFFDNKGDYSIAYKNENSGNAYILTFDSSMKIKRTIKIEAQYKRFGGAICDSSGNFYIVWGKDDVDRRGNVDTMAITKYKNNGDFVKTLVFRTASPGSNDYPFDTKYPFFFGGCSIVITKGVLVCNFAREMYSGHQGSRAIAANISDMSVNRNFDNYCSHSFDQRAIVSRNGRVYFADHGDAYDRGFCINANPADSKLPRVPFHFYGNIGENTTNAELGGICELGTGLVLVGASAKSMTSACRNQSVNMFIQLLDKSRTLPGSTSRTGTCGGARTTDKGVRWLTSYSSDYTVKDPRIANIGDDRIFVAWALYKNSTFIGRRYMIVSANGKILQHSTSMGKVEMGLVHSKNLLCKNGYICWVGPSTTANKAYIYKLKVGSLVR